jgi:hypothetical protein
MNSVGPVQGLLGGSPEDRCEVADRLVKAADRLGERRDVGVAPSRLAHLEESADLAMGYERVLVLSPFGGRSRHPQQCGMQLATQVDELRANGSSVETIFPDGNSLNAFGDNMMDLSARPAAARAGYDQGQGLAGELIEFWR